MYKTLNVPEGRREYFHELGVCMKLFFHYDSSKGKKIDNWITLSQNFSSPKERENSVWKQHISKKVKKVLYIVHILEKRKTSTCQ